MMKFNRNLAIIVAVFFIQYSCDQKHEEFTKVDEGVYQKLHSFSDDEVSYSSNHYIVSSINVFDKDELECIVTKYNPFKPQEYIFDNVIKNLNKGDSVSFIISKESFDDNGFGFKSDYFLSDEIKATVKIHDFISKEEFRKREIDSDLEIREQQILKHFLFIQNNYNFYNGVYYKKLKETTGNEIKKGDLIKVSYIGKYINGVIFDTTFVENSFEFKYGTPNQLIEGLEKMLKVLKYGEKAKIIIPSQFAFGDKGSSTGIVAPYSTVIYNLEIINN